MGNLFTRLSSFLFILIGRQPDSEKERSGFELARLVAQRIPNGHGFSFYIYYATAQQREEAQRIRAGSACSAAIEIIIAGHI